MNIECAADPLIMVTEEALCRGRPSLVRSGVDDQERTARRPILSYLHGICFRQGGSKEWKRDFFEADSQGKAEGKAEAQPSDDALSLPDREASHHHADMRLQYYWRPLDG